MQELSPMPSIAVTIGGQLRVYHAFVTTAGPELDGVLRQNRITAAFCDRDVPQPVQRCDYLEPCLPVGLTPSSMPS